MDLHEKRKNKCQKCSEPFEGPEFFSYILKLNSRKVVCIRCTTENFFVRKISIGYILLSLFSIFLGITLFFLPVLLLTTTTETHARTPIYAFIMGGALTLFTIAFLQNIYSWMFAKVSIDKRHKKIGDYD